MKTSPSEPEDTRQELIPALSPEVQERDPGLVALVRSLVTIEMRLAELPFRPGEPDPQEEAILVELEEAELALRHYSQELAVAAKVDNYTSMLAYLEWQRDSLDREVKRLTSRKRTAQAVIKRLLDAAQYALNLLPKPRYGLRELEGTQSSLVLVKNPGRVRVIDQAAVPAEYRQATIKMNLQLWQSLLSVLPQDVRDRLQHEFVVTDEVRLSALAMVLKTGVEVAGAEWVQDSRAERR